MATMADSSSSDSDAEIENNPSTNPNPNFSSGTLSPSNLSSPPLVCLLRFASDSAAGALMGSIFGYGVAGCCTGLALSFPGAPQALLQSCLTFGAFSFIIERLNKQQPALAHPSSARTKSRHYSLVPPLTLPLPNEFREYFTIFSESTRQSEKGNLRATCG